MKLKNKKTGEIVEFRYLQSDHVAPLVLSTRESDKPEMYTYNSLAELNDEWEDAPEEAELAVDKLKAWKRLKDRGFRFNRWTIPEEPKTPHIKLVIEAEMDVLDSPYDLDLLFGGEE